MSTKTTTRFKRSDSNSADDGSSSSSLSSPNNHINPTKPISHDAIRVLIAEDNPINQKVLQRMLHRLGVRNIDIVDNGKLAVETHASKPDDYYHIIYMDMQMPVMDGLEACRHITKRKLANSSSSSSLSNTTDDNKKNVLPKIIFVTANVTDGHENEAQEAGGDGFISKPFSIDGIERSLGLKR